MKSRILWLSKDKLGYALWKEHPALRGFKRFFGGNEHIYSFCGYQFEKLLPALKLRKSTKCKVKLIQLKNGIKLEKVR
jgi:hypothetical protein